MRERTVITGMGIHSCMGGNTLMAGFTLLQGKCGIVNMPQLAERGYRSTLCGVPDQIEERHVSWIRPVLRKSMSDVSLMAAMAVKEALEKSNLTDLSHTALIVSNDSTAGEQSEVCRTMEKWNDTRHLGAFSVFRTLNSTVSMNLAQVFGIGGLTLTVSAACAGGGHAVGLAHKLIQGGVVDSAIVVGAQEVGPDAFASFDALGVFAKDVPPEAAVRPFDKDRHGLVPSGGAACLVLESYRHASRRKAFRLAEVLGYGFSTSPNLITPSRDSLADCMESALCDAIRLPVSVDLVAAHATGTIDGDREEAEAIAKVMAHSREYHIAATKGLTGHECWMAGVSQVVYTLLQMQCGVVAPHPNYTTPDPRLPPLPLSKEPVRDENMSVALCNAFGFGGTNSSLVLRLLREI